MSFDLSSPFYQEVIKQGQALGYSPIAIASGIGNASVENGGKTSGAPGDTNVNDGLGGAYGGFQWRGARFDNLKAMAAQDGTAWTDPATQAKYYWSEMGGKYPNAGVPEGTNDQLRSATDLDTGVDAMVDYLKPKGWKGGDSNSTTVPTYSARLAAAQAAYDAMQSQGSSGGAGSSSADMPAVNAVPTAAQGTPGGAGPLYVGNQSVPAQAPAFQPPATSFGSRLMMAGAALMARDNPSGASALSGMVNSERNNDLQTAQLMASQQKQAGQNWTDHGPVANGKYTRQTDQYGNLRYMPVPEGAQDTEEDDKAKKADMLQFQTNADQMSNDRQVVNTAMQLKENLLSGKLTVSPTSQGVALVQNYTGTAGPNARDLKNMEALINIQIRNILAQEKGPATQMKLKQSLQQILPDGGKWDGTQVYDALDRMTDITRENYANVANTNRAYAKMYPGIASQAHGVDGKPIDFGSAYDGDLAKWTTQQQDFDSRKASFYARHDGQNARQPAKPSFLDFYGKQGGQAQPPVDPNSNLPLGPM